MEAPQASAKRRLVAYIWLRLDCVRLTSLIKTVLQAQRKPARRHMAAGKRLGAWVG